ncbi:MAG: hypothetical protein WA655_16110 [Candidatus Korobacteraceae bacterium]
MTNTTHRDQDEGKGVVERTAGESKTQVSLAGQSGHRDQDPLLKASDSDFPEPGQNEEHTGELHAQNQLQKDTEVSPEGTTQDESPGFRQKENQNKSKDDPLAA